MSKAKILIVEDERIVAEDIKRTLQNLGYAVCSIVTSGDEAVKKAEQDSPDLILMDIVLQDEMSGVDAAEQIRTRFNIPIIYLTAYADEKTLERAKITEPFGYIIKPFEERELHSTIELALYKNKTEKKILHLNSVLRAIRGVNQLITKERNRDRLIQGICNKLVEGRGYDNAWIVVIDELGKCTTFAESGLGKDFSGLVELMKRGEFPGCVQKALSQPGVLAINDVSSSCTDCFLSDKYKNKNKGALSARLESSGKIYGVLTISVSRDFVTDKDELLLFSEVSADVALGLHTIKIEEERKRAATELEESKSRLENIINNNADGIIIVDHKGIVRFANPAAEIIFSRKKEELVGELFGSPLVSNETTELDIIGKDGKAGVVEMRIVKIKWEGEIAYLSSLRDITEHKQIQHDLQMSFERSQRILEETVNSLASAFSKRDLYTAGHQQRVTKLAIAIAKEMGFSKKQIQGIRIAGLIHDIGKISVPAEILSKPSQLTDAEFEIVKEHPKIAYDIVKSIEFPWPVAEIIYQHHERLNGSGYPRGLRDGEILPETKILIVADVVEAMSSHRPYRPARGMKITLEEITKNRGILYDPQTADVCLMLIKEKGFKFD
ncbi:MAG: HD domain-containing phosphohydrolase [bacterium]